MVSINTELTANENACLETSDENVRPDSENHPRLKYTAEQNQFLESQFEINEFPTYTQRKSLANSIGISEYRVKNWFRNRRKETNPNNSSYVRKRAHINDEQLGILYEAYGINPRMNQEQRQMIATITGLPPKTVKNWFQNHRFRDNKRKATTHNTLKVERRGRPRKHKHFTKAQTDYLEECFLENPKPNRAEMEQIGVELDEKFKRILTWFSNRRIKSKVMQNFNTPGTLYGPLPNLNKTDEEDVMFVVDLADDDDSSKENFDKTN